jgi:uncharacterized protein
MFEWDEAKNTENFRKHGIRFEEAIGIFDRPVVTIADDRFDYGEERLVSIGIIRSLAFVVVVHTDREEATRLISARHAHKHERRFYVAEIKKGGRG